MRSKWDGLELGEPGFTDLANRLAELVDGEEGRGVALRTSSPVSSVLDRATPRYGRARVCLLRRRGLAPLRAAPAYALDFAILGELTQSYLREIRADIGGITIARDGFVDAAEQSAARYKFSNISGLPGCGKSVVLRRAVERAAARGPVLFLKRIVWSTPRGRRLRPRMV